MKKNSLFFLSLVALLISACEKETITGEGPVITETRSPGNFSGIDIRVVADVFYTQSPDYRVEIQGQQNILHVLETYNTNGNLVIRFKNDVRVRSHEHITINLSAPSVNSLHISGSGNITAMGAVSSPSMDLNVSGSANINLPKLTTGFIKASIDGSGNIKVAEGTATEERLNISGSGNIDLGNVPALKATTTTSGSGDTRVSVSESLDVTITGSGSVYYRGTPEMNVRISGSGKVVRF